MRIQTLSTNQVKCNFCFDWIYGVNFNKKNQNICDICLEKALNDQFLVSSHQQTFKLVFAARQLNYNGTCPNKNFLFEGVDQMMSFQIKEVVDKWNTVRFFLNERQDVTNQQRDIIEKNLQQINDENILFHNKASIFNELAEIPSLPVEFTLKKAQFLQVQQQNMEQNSNIKTKSIKLRSLIRTPLAEMDLNQINDETLDTSVDSKPQSKYDFYFDRKTILQFTSDKKSTHSNQLDLNLGAELFLNLNRFKPRSNRSNFSLESQTTKSGLTKDEVKSKINELMADRYLSQTYSRLMTNVVIAAYESTKITNKSIELISFNMSELDLQIYLNLFEFEKISVLKLVNVALIDIQLKTIIELIWNKKIEILVLTGNRLTQNCLSFFTNRSLPFLKEIYLGKNRIYKYRARTSIMQMRSKFTVYL